MLILQISSLCLFTFFCILLLITQQTAQGWKHFANALFAMLRGSLALLHIADETVL